MSDRLMADKDAWVSRVLGVVLPEAPNGQDDTDNAMEQWQTAREAAITSLDALASRVQRAKLADADAAIILLRAIRANLTVSPKTPEQIKALRRYLEEDDIIDAAETPNGYGITVNLRDPLLDALDALDALEDA